MIQMPVFFSLYFMLQNAVELRGQSFLWVHDLTKPDIGLDRAVHASSASIPHFTRCPSWSRR